MSLVVRPATRDEIDTLVRKTWTHSFTSSPRCVDLNGWAFRKAHRALVGELLDDSDVLVFASDDPDDDDIVLGWICFTPPVTRPLYIHFTYVKPIARRRGIALKLVRAAMDRADHRGWRASHWTREWSELLLHTDIAEIERGAVASG